MVQNSYSAEASTEPAVSEEAAPQTYAGDHVILVLIVISTLLYFAFSNGIWNIPQDINTFITKSIGKLS